MVVGLPTRLVRRIRLCRRCGLWKTRKLSVPGRGDVPADVLMIGEGPGRSENVRGLAFIGPTKRILDAAVQAAAVLAGWRACLPRLFYANTVCCRPCDGKRGPNRSPTPEEAWACQQHLEAIHRAVRPKRVVLLGEVPKDLCSKLFPRSRHLYHPAFLLRRGGTACPEFRIFSAGLAEVFEEVCE